jgi:hypothetical protein
LVFRTKKNLATLLNRQDGSSSNNNNNNNNTTQHNTTQHNTTQQQQQHLKKIAAFLSGLALNDFVAHFEPAHFSRESLSEAVRSANVRSESSHRISKRSAGTSGRYQIPVKFNFTAHNR